MAGRLAWQLAEKQLSAGEMKATSLPRCFFMRSIAVEEIDKLSARVCLMLEFTADRSVAGLLQLCSC